MSIKKLKCEESEKKFKGIPIFTSPIVHTETGYHMTQVAIFSHFEYDPWLCKACDKWNRRNLSTCAGCWFVREES